MLPIPATRLWSSSASPRPRVGSRPHRRRHRAGIEAPRRGCRGRGAPAGDRGAAPRPAAPQRRPAELDRLLLGPCQDGPGRGAGPAPGSAAAIDVPAAAHPQVAVEDEVAEVRAPGACRAPRRDRAFGRRAARCPAARPRGLGAATAISSPPSAASIRRAARRIVSPSAIPAMMTGALEGLDWTAMAAGRQIDPLGRQAVLAIAAGRVAIGVGALLATRPGPAGCSASPRPTPTAGRWPGSPAPVTSPSAC